MLAERQKASLLPRKMQRSPISSVYALTIFPKRHEPLGNAMDHFVFPIFVNVRCANALRVPRQKKKQSFSLYSAWIN